jgi:hypothetical protein
LRAALAGDTAAVTGVIASLSLWFALSVLWPNGLTGGFEQVVAQINWPALALIASGAAISRLTKGNLFILILANALLGFALFTALGL